MKDLARHQDVAELVAIYEQAERDMRAGFALVVGAEEALRLAFGGDIRAHSDRYAVPLDFTDPDRQFVEIRRTIWTCLIDRLELRRFTSIAAWEEIERAIKKDQPQPITVANVMTMARGFRDQIPEMALAMVTEVFDWLRPREWGASARFKTNDPFIVGRTIKIDGVLKAFDKRWPTLHHWQLCYHEEQRFLAFENVLNQFDGRGAISKNHWSELSLALRELPSGDTPCAGETSLFTFRGYKNGSLHLTNKRMDLIAKFNAKASGKNLAPSDEERITRKAARRAGICQQPRSEDDMNAKIGTKTLTDRQRELLALAQIENNVATFGASHLPDWAALKTVMEALGGKWKTRVGFLFPDDVDAAELVRCARETGEIIDPRAADFFETSPELSVGVCDWAELEPHHEVLEPSAGKGALALEARRRGCPVLCVEPLAANRKALEKLGFQLIGDDFLKLAPAPRFERVVMNPPFSKRAELFHVDHARRLLKPGGILVAVMSAGVKYRQDQRGVAFRALLAQYSGEIRDNPPGSFKDSGTMVNTVTVKLVAPGGSL